MSNKDIFQAIITDCIGRTESFPGISPEQLEAQLQSDPIYVLASQGLKNCVTESNTPQY
jgi:serine/threonine protein phosphatase PrpC